MNDAPITYTQPDVTIYNPAEADFINHHCGLSRLATGFRFTEGPLWHKNGYLLLSDMPANKIFKVRSNGTTEVFMGNSGFSGGDRSMLSEMIGSCGITVDAAGRLLVCRQGSHAIARLEDNGQFSVITDQYGGRPFNSPNDIIVRKDGSIYFSDPPYGLKDQVLHPGEFQPAAGVYCYKGGKTSLVSTDFRYPNGVCLSTDETALYVGSNHPDEPYLVKYMIAKDGSLHSPDLFLQQNADGIKTDEKGNLYLATMEGILVVSPEGLRLALVPVPEMPTNIAFGGAGRRLLFITAVTSVYTLSLFN